MKAFLKIKYILIMLLPFLPAVVLAGLVPCGGSVDDPGTVWNETDDCGFSHLILMIAIIIEFLLINIAVPIAAMLFAYAGFLMMTAGGNEAKISQAKQIFGGVLWGLLIAVLAWVIVHTVLVALGMDASYSYLSSP